jgi:hypothetical protein
MRDVYAALVIVAASMIFRRRRGRNSQSSPALVDDGAHALAPTAGVL